MSNLALDLSPENAPWRFRDSHPDIYRRWIDSKPSPRPYTPLSVNLFPCEYIPLCPIKDARKMFLEIYEPRESSKISELRQQLIVNTPERIRFLSENSIVNHQSAGFKVRRYRSGEMSGAMFTTGTRNKIIPSPRSGCVETSTFTIAARQKIRRAVENSDCPLNYFLTLTFAPKLCNDWEKDENGNIRHDFAKYKLKCFRDALQKHVQRRYNEKLLFVWVAELQKNGNIHFHMLLNRRLPVQYLRKIWNIGNLDVQYLNNSNHAVNYIRKYISKADNSLIRGNRYNISSGLRLTMKPDETIICSTDTEDINEDNKVHADVMNIIKLMRDDIEEGGGTVLDFGFSIPRPRRPVDYYCKKSKKKKRSKGVRHDLADNVFHIIGNPDEIPF